MITAYLKTTIPSYLAAYPSRDLIIAAHQQITSEWWQTANTRFNLFISEAVLAEIRYGDEDAASRRLKIIEGIPVLAINEDILFLIQSYGEKLGLKGRAKADIPHFAFAVSYKMDYLITWNCAHIANGEIIRRLMNVNSELNRHTPLIVTPDEILETLGDNEYEK